MADASALAEGNALHGHRFESRYILLNRIEWSITKLLENELQVCIEKNRLQDYYLEQTAYPCR